MANNNQKFIKSYSVFVKKKTHQQVNDGTIFERDWLTTGGVDKFLPGQIPIYKNGNFIITVNNDPIQSKDYVTDDFEKINGQDEWTLEEIEKAETNEDNNITPDNLLKNNIYDLRDFAYFGSCVELIRGTINGLLKNFPGELYFSNSVAYYTYKAPRQEAEMRQINVNGYQYVVANPFEINLHLADIRNPENPLKYFANNGYKNYEIIIGKATNGTEITSFSVSPINNCASVGEDIATIQINSYIIKYVKGETVDYYMHNMPDSNIHIRPKKEIIDTFFSNLDSFESVLLNRNTSPAYTAKFNIIQETDYGIKTVCETFTFPTGEGKYNIGGTSEIFSSYLKRLIGIAERYDELYTDNIYRMLTHETLKNFDFTMYKDNPNAESYEEGNDRLKKVLRLYGREFDEIRNDIEGIKDNYFLGYKELSEQQRKFLKFKLINEGFDVKNVYPLVAEANGECYKFSADTSSIYQPFNETYNYYYNNGVRTRTNETSNEIIINNSDGSYCIARVFKKYKTDNTFNSKYINDEFFKRLRLNSRRILRHKGTATGIEMILALFGLKSKRMVQRMDTGTTEILGLAGDTENYDYDIYESWIEGIQPITGEDVDKIKFYNSTKILDFNSDSIYAGLPVIEVNDSLYPFFDDTEYYDGFMHYQMNGGWLNYTNQVFNKDNCLVEGGYTDTLRDVRTVNSIDELLEIPYNELYNDMIVKILNRNINIAITDTQTFNILYDSNDLNKERPYVYLYSDNGYFHSGNKEFSTIQTVSYDSNGNATNVEYDATNMPSGKQIKVYLNNNNQLTFDYNGYDESKITRESNDDVSMYRKYHRDEGSTDFNTLNNWQTISEAELKVINKVVTYMEGNNPHNPNPVYDNGEEYLNRFRQLFKYALENDMFDTRCYGSIAQYYREKPQIGALGFDINGEREMSVADRDNQSYTEITIDTPVESYSKMSLKRIRIDFAPLFNKINRSVDFQKYFLAIIMSYCSQFIPSTAICTINNG